MHRRHFNDTARPASGLDRQLMEAAREGNTKAVDRMIRQGANVFVDCERPLLDAATNGHFDVVKLLVAEGSLGRYRYQAPMFEAMNNGHPEIATFLKDAIKRDRGPPTGSSPRLR